MRRQNMNRRSRILAAAVLAAGLAAVPALAQDGAAPHGGRMGGALRQALSSLDLTQDQKDKIHAIRDAEKPTIQSLREQMRQDAQALRATEDSGGDAAAVGSAFLKVRGDRQAIKAE